VATVARNRGERVPTVRNGFGQGRVVNGKEAEAERMVDGVMSLDAVLKKMVGTVRKPSSKSSALEAEQELHAAYLGSMDTLVLEQSPVNDSASEELRTERERRVVELKASEREERLREMENV
jgi:ClpP class serine protease